MPIAVRSREARNQHVWPEGANHSHHVTERDIVPSPLLEGLVGILRIAEIGNSAEALFHAVIAIGGRQLQRAQHAQHVEQIASDFVLPAFAASERHQQRGHAFAARLESQHAAIFVVGMRDGLHQASGGLQAKQHLLQSRRACVGRQRIDRAGLVHGSLGHRRCRHRGKTGQQSEAERSD